MEGRSDARRRLVIPDAIDPIHNLDPLHRAPTGHEGARASVTSAKQIATASFTTPRVLDGVEVHPSAPQLASNHAFI